MSDCHILRSRITRIIRAVTFLQNKLVDDIFDHQDQTPYPEDIDDDVVFVVKSKTQQRPSDEDNVLHVVEKEDARAVELFEYLFHLCLKVGCTVRHHRLTVSFGFLLGFIGIHLHTHFIDLFRCHVVIT